MNDPHRRAVGALLGVLLLCLAAPPSAALGQSHPIVPELVDAEPSRAVVVLLVVDRAAAHGIDPAPLACTLWRESRFRASARGRRGEVGLAQWLPGRRNAWDISSAWRTQRIDIVREYETRNPDAPYFDVDAAAELFAFGAATRKRHWAATYCELWPPGV